MKIGLLLPSILTTPKFRDRIYAPQHILKNLADAFVDKGHTVRVYSSSSFETKAKVIGGIEELEESNLHSIKDVWKNSEAQKELTPVREMYEYGLDLVHKAFRDAQEGEIEVLHAYDDFIAHYLGDLCSVPLVFTLHDIIFPEGTLERWRQQHFNSHQAIAISQAQRIKYENVLKTNVVATIYHGIDPNSFTFNPIGSDDLLFSGRYLPLKGVEDAILAALKLGKKLRLASSSNYKSTDYYKQSVEPHLSSPLIEELPYLEKNYRDNVYGNSKAMLLPIKLEESFGMVMVESMLAGTPVVAYGRGSVPEIIIDGKTGFVVDPAEGLDGFTKAVEKLYALSDQEYLAMRLNCRKRVEEHFSLEQMISKHELLYQDLISKAQQK